MIDEIKFYIIIPVHNGEKYILKCLESITKQVYENWNAIIIDDFSIDSTFKLLTNYIIGDHRFKIISNIKNEGPGKSRNNGIIKSLDLIQKIDRDFNNNYFVFLDSDDWIDYRYLKIANDLILKDKPDVVFVDVIQEDESGKIIRIEQMSRYKSREKIDLIKHQLTGKLPWGGVRKLANAKLFDDEKIRFSDDFNGEEAIYSFRLLNKASNIKFIEEPLYHYIIHTGSQSRKKNLNPYGEMAKKLENEILNHEDLDLYIGTLRSFQFSALIINIYRNVLYNGIFKSYSVARKEIKNYSHMYGFKMDIDSLDNRLKLFVYLSKLNLVFVILLISKLKTFKRRVN